MFYGNNESNEMKAAIGLKEETKAKWKVFSHDTEAGRLLSRLYGVQPGGKPKIKYPTLNKKKTEKVQHISKWQNVNTTTGGRDPRETSFDRAKALSVAVPKVGNVTKNTTTAVVELIPKRRREIACQQTVKSYSIMKNSYRPPNHVSLSTDTEKERLSEIFTYKGGRALPNEIMSPVGLMPSEIAQKAEEQNRAEKARIQRRDRLNGKDRNQTRCSNPSKQNNNMQSEKDTETKSTLFDQITNEIKERRQFQIKMEDIGDGASTRHSIANEIASRVHELRQLDPERASKVVKELYQN